MRQQATAIGFIALLLLSAVALPVNASASLNYSDDGKASNPYADVDTLTVESWNNSDFDSPLEYYDDSGEASSLRATVNRSSDVDDIGTGAVNPLSVTATDIEVDAFDEYPRKSSEGDNGASALDASEWTTSGATISDVTTAPSVTAVEYAGTDSSNSSTYSNVSITSDVEKRYVQIAADISSASGTPTFEIHDSDGDYVTIELYNSSANQSVNDVLANSTGEGHVEQTQIGELTVEGSGDGSMGEITEIKISGDVNADFSLINTEKTSRYTFGQKYVDTDDDDDLETETIHDPHGDFSVHSVDTFGSIFDDAVYHGLSYPAQFKAEHLASEDVQTSFASDNAFPNWDSVADLHFRLKIPSAYDLSYSGVDLVQNQRWSSTRYAAVEVKEDTGDTAFDDIDNWSDKTSTFSSQDSTHTLDSTVSVGTNYVVHVELKLTEDEASAMQSGGGAAPMGGDDSGGLLDFFIGLPGIAVVALAGIGGRIGGIW